MSNIASIPDISGGSGSKPIKQLGGLPNLPPTYAPPSGTGGADTGNTPGTYNVNPFEPGQTAANALQETEGGLAGLKNALFGISQPDAQGKHGGFLGDIPGVGDALRAGSEALSNIGQTVGGVGHNVLAGIGGGLEHVDLGSAEQHADTQAKFDAIPDTYPGKSEALDAIARDPGATGHYMSKVINEYNAENISKGILAGKPDFTTGAFHQAGSAAEAFDNIIGALGLTARAAERTWAGVATPAQMSDKGWTNRLDTILLVGNEALGNKFNPDKGLLGTGILAGEQTSGLNSVEAIVYKKVTDGEWTRDQAMDFLAATNQGYSHSTIANIAGNVALDPQNLVTLGAGAIAKVGETGAKIALTIDKAAEAADLADKALDTARTAGVTGERMIELTKAADAAHAELTAAQGAYKIGGDVSKLNVLGRAARNEAATALVKNIYRTYEPLQKVHIDKVLKVSRGIVDPLGAITLHNPFRKQMLDLMTDDAAKTVVGAYGDGNHAGLVHALADATEGASSPLADQFSRDFGVYSGNLTRRVIARTQRDVAAASGNLSKFVKQGVNEVLAGVGDKVPVSWQEGILQEANKFRKFHWDEPAIKNLASRMEDNYGVKTADEWEQWFKDSKLNPDQLGMLHAATYGSATRRILRAVEQAAKQGLGGELADKLHRLILINRTTLTEQGAKGILDRIENAGGVDAAMEEIKKAQELYPELRGFTLDATDPGGTVERFAAQLKRKLEAFPSQVMDHELAQLPDDLKALHTDSTYTLGFSPKDEFKWGVERANVAGGELKPIYDVWVDHVADGLGTGYRTAGRLVEQNVAGQPIIGAAGRAIGRSLDYIDAGVRTMGRRVSGSLIAETARNRFIQTAVHRYEKVGITEDVAKDIIEKLDNAVSAQDIVVRPSGFSTKVMWEVAKQAIPKGISKAEFGPREVMDLVLDAYQGDMRYVGLTQALSSRIKRVLALDSNNASALAEQAYPILKYRLNVIFQAQEKIEPWVLNSIRGVTPARSAHRMNDADKATMNLLETMAQRSLVSNADHEMAEQSAKVLYGKTLEEMALDPDKAMGQISKKLGVDWASLRDVKGVKQINMLRTFRKGMGKELRAAWDQVEPGLFDDMYQEAVRKAKRGAGGLDEDEFAVSMLAESMLGNGVIVDKNADWLTSLANRYGKVDYRAAITPAEWTAPATLGALRTLGLDDMAELLAFPLKNGKVTKTEGDIRAALAAGDITMDDIKQGLRRLNADPDHIRRVQSALEFSWTGFFDQVAHDFNLTPDRRRYYEELIGNAAELRGMKPIDYLSQIIVPTIGEGGTEAAVGHLGKIVDIIDGKTGNVIDRVPSLGGFNVASDAAGNEEQFVGQLAHIFSAHLDPSAKKALIGAFMPEMKQRMLEDFDISMDAVNALWTPEMEQQFTKYIMGEIEPPPLSVALEQGRLRTMEDWNRVDPQQPVTLVNRETDQPYAVPVKGLIGDNLRNAAPHLQKDILSPVSDMRQIVPGLKLEHVDIAGLKPYLGPTESADGVLGLTLRSSDGEAVMLSPDYYGGDLATYQQRWAGIAAEDNAYATRLTKNNDVARNGFYGAPGHVDSSPAGTIRHELAHVMDEQFTKEFYALKKASKLRTARGKQLQAYMDFRAKYLASPARFRASEYSAASDFEGMAELLSLAVHEPGKATQLDAATQAAYDAYKSGKGAQIAYHAAPTSAYVKDFGTAEAYAQKNRAILESLSPFGLLTAEQQNALNRFDIALEELDMLDPNVFDYEFLKDDLLRELKLAARRVDVEKNAAIKQAQQDAQMLGEPFDLAGLHRRLDRGLHFGSDHFQSVDEAVKDLRKLLIDNGDMQNIDISAAKAALAGADDPDVARAVHMFGRWTTGVMADGIKQGPNAIHAGVLDKIAAIPTHQAVPYNFTEDQLMQTAIQSMKDKWDDAYRLQYYSRQRTMLERSINHPMFGIYPASYMWGKVLPEMIKFMAQTPFGLRTGLPAYAYRDITKSVALQREFDPEFDKQIDKTGHSASFFALGYMLPSWPWEASSAFPGWSREFAQEGLDMQARADNGGTAASPTGGSTGINVQQVAGKAADLINPVNPVNKAILQPIKEITAQPQQAAPYFDNNPNQPVAAGDLGNPLTDALQSLRDLLGG